jgi:hypothetical protein
MENKEKTLDPEFRRIVDEMYNTYYLYKDYPHLQHCKWDLGAELHRFLVLNLPEVNMAGRVRGTPDNTLFGVRVERSKILPPKTSAFINEKGEAIHWYEWKK